MSKNRKNSSTSTDRRREVIGVVGLGAGLFLLIAMISLQAHTLVMGPFGRSTASLFYGLAGICSYGLVALGLAKPQHIKRNSAAQAGDLLVLGKPLGVGVYSAALKKGSLDADGYAQMIAATTRLNTPGPRLAELDGVHAMTDVTGFGLLGHLLEVCRGAGLQAQVRLADIPWLPQAQIFAGDGFITGFKGRSAAT